MSNVRIADPITVNGKVYFTVQDAYKAILSINGIDGSDRYRLLLGVLSADLQTQELQIVVANNDPLVKGSDGKYQFNLDSTIWSQWVTTYNTVKLVNPDSARELCHLVGLVIKDCPADKLPQVGDVFTSENIQALVPYQVSFGTEAYDLSYIEIRVSSDNQGTIVEPLLYYANVSSTLELIGIDYKMFNNFFGYLIELVLSKNADIKQWHAYFKIPMSDGEIITAQVNIPNSFAV